MTTLEALKASRDHWIEMRDNKNTRENPTGKDCALCQLFQFDDNCDGCPIAEHTKANFCARGPYLKAFRHFNDRLRSDVEWKKWQEAADKMVKFLEKLLTEYETTGRTE